MMLGVANLVRFVGVDLPKRLIEIVPQILGVCKIPSFEMPLCICAPDCRPDFAAEEIGKFIERIQNLVGTLSIHI